MRNGNGPCHSAVACLLAAALGVTATASATDAPVEIAQLLDIVASSDCTFFRNDTARSAAEAREHMERKYDYVQKRVRTTEDFIELAASRSSMTGRAYYVECPNRERETAWEWLTGLLKALRGASVEAVGR